MKTEIIQGIVFFATLAIIIYWKYTSNKNYYKRKNIAKKNSATAPTHNEENKEAEEKKEVHKHHDNHDDDHGHGNDDHGHGKVEKKPEKVLTTGEKIFMWILLIPLMFILIFILIPGMFPTLWSDLGGPILWEGKIFLPIIIMLFIAILLGILTNNWLYLIFIIGFCILSYFIKKDNQNEAFATANETEIQIFEFIPVTISGKNQEIRKLVYQGKTPVSWTVRHKIQIRPNQCGKITQIDCARWDTPITQSMPCDGKGWEDRPFPYFEEKDVFIITTVK